ncbi:MAG: L-Ala-D/L-Glu epimerase [Syntrophorhabdus sp. PtaU1.Bin050]|nr:MAG: L-Ala-D/L-Glu epimerase [Syntrophorhabdus sp. PtaU1.Bin050]
MKITKVQVTPITVPYRIPLRHAWGGRTAGNYIVVQIETDEGITGIGSGAVLAPRHSGESIDGAMAHIAIVAPEALLGKDPFQIEAIMKHIDTLLYANWLTKAPIDFALYDLKGKALNVPVYDLLGGLVRDKALIEFIVSLDEPEAMADMAKRYMDAGFAGLKIKAGGDPKLDIERFKRVRRAVGPETRISVDMNEIYTRPIDALPVIQAMTDMGIVYIEQPVPRYNISGMRFIKDRINVPMCSDEGGWSLREAQAMVDAKATDIFHTVPSRIGGFTKAIKYRSIVESAGLDMCVSAYNGTGLEHAASCHFIFSTNLTDAIPEQPVGILYLYGGFSSDDIVGDIIRKTNGRIKEGYLYKPEGPGLGVELDQEMVDKYLTPGKKPMVLSI